MAANELIKRAHTQVEMTMEQVRELERCANDPVYFINNYCWIQNQNEGKVKFKLRPYQIRIVESLHKNRFNILLQGRQTGKSETTAAYAFWFANFHENKNVLVASNKQKGATDIMNRIKFMYENTPDFLRAGVLYYNRGTIEFDNDSKIWSEATTESTGRGRSVALFILDELAHVNHRIQNDMWGSILGTISSGDKLACVIMSTPNGDQDLFAELWRGAIMGTNGFVPNEVKITEVPGRDQAWIDDQIRRLGELTVRQEFLCEFLSSDALLINSLVLQRLQEKKPLYIDKGFNFWKQPVPTSTYIVSVDVAEGMGKDYSTIEVFELETLEQVAEFRDNKIKEDKLYDAIKWIIDKLESYIDPHTHKKPMVYWSFENNSAGAVIGVLYRNDDKFSETAELITIGEKNGMRTTNKSKVEACRSFKNLVEKKSGGLLINSLMLITELKNYVAHGASYAAKSGCTDDLVSACLILARILKFLSTYEAEVFDKIYRSDGEFYEETTSEHIEPMPFAF